MKVIIIGGGQVGAYIANLLLKNDCDVKVIENNETNFAKLKKYVPEANIVLGNGTDPNVLEACGIAEADVVAAVTGADETNLVASTISKFEFSVPRVIARVNNPNNAWLFNFEMGVDVGLNQADLMAHLVVEEMPLKNLLTLMEINGGNYSIVQVEVSKDSDTVNKHIKDLDIPENAVLIAVHRGKEVIIPRGNTSIKAGDNILAFSNVETKAYINKLFGSKN